MHAEGGKPRADALVEVIVGHRPRRLVRPQRQARAAPRRVRGSLLLPEFSGTWSTSRFGVIGVIGPWNYPILTPMGSIAYALAAGNAVVFKPSEYTPAVGQWYVDRFAEVVPEHPVLQIVHGAGETGAHARAGPASTRSRSPAPPRTARKIMAACAETLTPVLIEGGGKDAMIVDTDADVDAAAEAAVWGAMTNAGPDLRRHRAGLRGRRRSTTRSSSKVVDGRERLTVGTGPDADIGPITMPGQIDVIRRHIDDAIARGGRAVLGGPDAVQPPLRHARRSSSTCRRTPPRSARRRSARR